MKVTKRVRKDVIALSDFFKKKPWGKDESSILGQTVTVSLAESTKS